jgi:myo-inositol-1(or 4)-monophosphatase
MTRPDHSAFLEFALQMAQAAGEAILPHFRVALDVGNKDRAAGYDPVTVADLAAETVIRREIARAWPDHGIRGEEHGIERGASNYTWVIDPIDGTRSFILGQLHWATLIALHDGERVVAGVAHQPFVGESFSPPRRAGAVAARGARRTLATRRCGGR